MSARDPRWEIVRTAAGWHARFRARNHRVIVSTEVYERKQNAIRAVRVVQFDSPGRELREVDEAMTTPDPTTAEARAAAVLAEVHWQHRLNGVECQCGRWQADGPAWPRQHLAHVHAEQAAALAAAGLLAPASDRVWLCSQCGEMPSVMVKIGTSDGWCERCLDLAAVPVPDQQAVAADESADHCPQTPDLLRRKPSPLERYR